MTGAQSARIEDRVANHFTSHFLRSYTRSKLRSDPVYRAVSEVLRGSTLPLFDVGCGVGLLEFYLRENGFTPAITGIDHDARKIEQAKTIGRRYDGLTFRAGDARDAFAPGSSVLLIDVLHYFTRNEQRAMLAHAASATPPGGLVIIRDAIRDGSWRYRLTAAQETFSRLIRWLRAERLNFPTREEITGAFEGFEQQIAPMWGRTPFNNYLFVFRRSSDGITNR